MAEEKLTVEIIDDSEGGSTGISPDDFRTVREFNAALARLKAAARARDFEESQDLKARRQTIKDQKMTFDEEKAVKKKEIEQTRLTVQEMKARRQVEVVISQQQRAREAEINKRDRHREMMLRHILGAVNPNSTFQYRMSSIYGLLNTAGITSERDMQRIPGQGEGVYSKVQDIMKTMSDGLRSLFGQTRSFISQTQTQKSVAQSIIGNATARTTGTMEPSAASSPENEEAPWWWDYRPKGFRPTQRDKMKSVGQMLHGQYQSQTIVAGNPPVPPGGKPPVPSGGNPPIPPGGNPPVTPSGATPMPGGGGFQFMAGGFVNIIGKAGLGLAGFVTGTAAVVTGLTALYGSLNLVSRRFVSVSDELKTWSITLTMAKTETTLRTMAFNMERAQRFGTEFSEFERAKTTADIGMAKLYDSITMPFMPLVSGSYNLLGRIADGISEIIDMFFTFTGGRFILDIAGDFIGMGVPAIWDALNNPDSSRGAGIPMLILQALQYIANKIGGADKTPSPGELGIARGLADFLNMPIPDGKSQFSTVQFSGFPGTIGN